VTTPRSNIRALTAQFQEEKSNRQTSARRSASAAAVAQGAATPRNAIRQLTRMPSTVKRSRVVEEGDDDDDDADVDDKLLGAKSTPRTLIREVSAFDDTPMEQRLLRYQRRTPGVADVVASALSAGPEGRGGFHDDSSSSSSSSDDDDDGDKATKASESSLRSDQRLAGAASAASRGVARSLQSQAMQIGARFADPGASFSALDLFLPGAGVAQRKRTRALTSEHKAAMQRGRAQKKLERAAGAGVGVERDLIGGAAARREPGVGDDAAGALPPSKKRRALMPTSWLKPVFMGFAAGATMGEDVLAAVVELSNQHLERAVDDLIAYNEHKTKKSTKKITPDDVELLFKRQTRTGEPTSVNELARELLPAELRREVVPIARYHNEVVPAEDNASGSTTRKPRRDKDQPRRRRGGTAAP
jgi:hypothetical protein